NISSFISKILLMPITLILLGVFLLLMFRKTILKMLGIEPTIKGDAPNGFKKVAKKYGVDFARDLERMFRKETRHFESKQWLNCGTPGMEAKSLTFPFGWDSLGRWAKANGVDEKDFFIKYFKDNHTGKNTPFVGFKNTGHTVLFIAWFIQNIRGGDIYSWYRLPINDKAIAQRKKYAFEMAQINTHFV
ncbi:MAG: hypothetical protein ACK5B9_00785, partial [Flavobacteriia bacterium]